MSRTPAWLAAAAATAALALVGAACGTAGPYAARVGGTTISQDDLEGELRAIASNEAYLAQVEQQLTVRGTGQGTFDAAFTAEVLSRQILYVMVRQELERREVTLSDADRAAARPIVAGQAGGDEVFGAFPVSYQDLLVARAAEVNRLTLALLGQVSADEAARAYYDANPTEFLTACVSHILVSDRAVADDVKARLDAGADFAALARERSQDTLTAAEGGNLGCDVTPSTPFVPEFLAAVFAQPVGVAGSPVQSSFGFHVIKVVSRDSPTYEQAASDALDRVVTSGGNELRDWVEGAVEGVEVEVNPKYGTYRKAGTSSGVVPPQAPATVGPTTTQGPPGLPVP